MNKKLFGELVESMNQMSEIARGERAPSREFCVNADSVKKLRSKAGLSQAEFAQLMHVELATLRNWEQGRREPTGPAKALIRAIEKDPEHVLKALASASRAA
jgi:putative transcriptional regulator